MSLNIKVAILEDHYSIIDSYIMRLGNLDDIEISGIAKNAEDLDAVLIQNPSTNILILDLSIPISSTNHEYIKILQYLPHIIEKYPNLDILVISLVDQPHMIKAVVDAGISGYFIKDDEQSIINLPKIVRNIVSGQTYFPDKIRKKINEAIVNQKNFGLTARQLEILSKCAEFPNASNEQIAIMAGISHSTVRTLLSESYMRLQVHTKIAALTKAKSLGLIT